MQEFSLGSFRKSPRRNDEVPDELQTWILCLGQSEWVARKRQYHFSAFV